VSKVEERYRMSREGAVRLPGEEESLIVLMTALNIRSVMPNKLRLHMQ